jgi:hypothetical protein
LQNNVSGLGCQSSIAEHTYTPDLLSTIEEHFNWAVSVFCRNQVVSALFYITVYPLDNLRYIADYIRKAVCVALQSIYTRLSVLHSRVKSEGCLLFYFGVFTQDCTVLLQSTLYTSGDLNSIAGYLHQAV